MDTDFLTEYGKVRPRYKQLTKTMQEFLTQLLLEEQIDYLSPVQARTKSLISFQDKLERKNYKSPLSEITDLTGLRIIVFYPDEIDRIKEVIKENFKVDQKNSVDKRESLSKNQFSYEGIHYVVSIKSDDLKQPEYREFVNMKFEIQILSLCQFAWAQIQRKIEYKSETLVPYTLSRRLARLVALFELADDEFMTIRDEETKALMSFRISRMSLKRFLYTSSTLRSLMRRSIESGFAKMNDLDDTSYLAELLEACSSVGFQDASSFDVFLRSEDNFSSFLNSKKLHEKGFVRIGPALLSLLLVYHSDTRFTKDILSGKGWKDPVLTILVDRSQGT
jgi:ppGpp synthetase/RelA/SpoT-type nucleotidyltranferase